MYTPPIGNAANAVFLAGYSAPTGGSIEANFVLAEAGAIAANTNFLVFC